MEDIGQIEAAFSLARVRGGGSSDARMKSRIHTTGSSADFLLGNQEDQLIELINNCKVILLSDIPYAFMDTFRAELSYDQGELADRLNRIPGLVILPRRGGDKKVVVIEFLTYLLVTKGFYDAFSHRQENWPSKEGKIRTHLQKHINNAASLHPLIQNWCSTDSPCLWETFSSFWINDYCITWFRDGVNWRPKSVHTVLQNHKDLLEVFLENQQPTQRPAPKPPNPAQVTGKTGRKQRKSVNNESSPPKMLSVDTEPELLTVLSEHFLFSSPNSIAAINIEMDNACSSSPAVNKPEDHRIHEGRKAIAMMEIVTTGGSSIQIDCRKVGIGTVGHHMSDFFADEHRVKIFHSLFHPAINILCQAGVDTFHGCVDSQLALEYFTGDVSGTLESVVKYFGALNDRTGMPGNKIGIGNPSGSQHQAQASRPALLLWKSQEHMFRKLGEVISVIKNASENRAMMMSRKLVFDKENGYALTSAELIRARRPNAEIFEPKPFVVNSDIDEFLSLLPHRIRESIEQIGTENLTEVILDKGRAPSAWIDGKRYFLRHEGSPFVDQADIDFATKGLGEFGNDNRAGIERQLHRVSCMRNRAGKPIGLTLRLGRNIDGIADMICDILLGCGGSILFLGEPASGKTTIVREAAKLLSENDMNVCIIDTSNEIAGDGDVPHPCVGHARRMMVPSLDQQANVMIECVQNHAPAVMVIDEIGRITEVEAARTCKQRGVRMIASAHGDLRKLVKNPKLKGLIGGVETVTLGDTAAKSEAKERGFSGMHKLRAQRAGTPVFDMIVEIRRQCPHEWYITLDTSKAVDSILEGAQYEAQRRVRNPKDGSFHLMTEKR